MHLAQLNVGRLRAPLDDTLIDDFRNNLEPVNALGEGAPEEGMGSFSHTRYLPADR